jgi:hypothetical protein
MGRDFYEGEISTHGCAVDATDEWGYQHMLARSGKEIDISTQTGDKKEGCSRKGKRLPGKERRVQDKKEKKWGMLTSVRTVLPLTDAKRVGLVMAAACSPATNI